MIQSKTQQQIKSSSAIRKNAEKLFNANNYADSRKWYYKAWDVKPDENKPKQQIDNINELLKQNQKNQNQS